MYRRSKFLEILHEIREEMSREADYDMDLFAERVRSGKRAATSEGVKFQPPLDDAELWNIELRDTKS